MQVPTFPNTQHMRYSVEGNSHPTFWRESEATVGSLAGRAPDDNGETEKEWTWGTSWGASATMACEQKADILV